MIIALAGNPNSGKTALFNALTGLRQHVGNWPGVTVDQTSGYFQHEQHTIQLMDLPGVYSTAVTTESAVDETITCDYLLSHQADVIVNVIDGSNLVRNLYLTLQLLEMGLPVVIALNMMDVVKQRGITLDIERFSQSIGCPVVPIVASQGQGMTMLKSAIVATAQKKKTMHFTLPLPEPLQRSLACLTEYLRTQSETSHPSWLALRLLEQDYYAEQQVSDTVLAQTRRQLQYIQSQLGEEADIIIADARYTLANQISDEITVLKKSSRKSVTERIDAIVLNRWLGIPIFFVLMYGMFLFAINIGGVFQDFFDRISTTFFVDGFSVLLQQWHCPAWCIAILANGIGKGINTVITFAPVIGAMFLFLAFLEDVGYMARAAFVMDRFMQWLGLPGRSFVPMIVGFGCNVPAVMGVRTLANPRDRILTVMMMPFMSCGARLAIFSVFASAFFPKHGSGVIFILYMLGIIVAVLSGLVLRKTVLRGKPAPLIMELPSYHMPRFRTLSRHAWHRLKNFIWRAGKYIVPICVLIGVLNSISVRGHLVTEGDRQTLLSQVGRAITPVFAPMGVTQENWPATVGLATGILAKEVVVGTLNTLYSHSELTQKTTAIFNFWHHLKNAFFAIPENLAQLSAAVQNPIAASAPPHEMTTSAYGAMAKQFDGRVGAFAYLLFVLLYFPCISTMAVMRREVGARWAWFSVCWSTGLAYALAVICYQALTLGQHPLHSLLWVAAMMLLLGAAVFMMRWYAYRDHPLAPLEERICY